MKTTFIVSGLALVLGCAVSPGLAVAADAVSDTAITAQAKAKLMDTEGLNSSHIRVTTTDGVVTLRGVASSTEAKASAENAVQSVEGAKRVNNDLRISGSGAKAVHTRSTANHAERVVSDSWITTKVKSELLGDSISKGIDVGVETTHGVVVLNGRLPTSAAVEHVKSIAQGVDGVRSVNTSALTVSAY